MRISCERQDEGFPEYAAALKARKLILITVDGVQQREVITADEEEGFILQYETDANGRLEVSDGNAVIKRSEGAVKIEIVEREAQK